MSKYKASIYNYLFNSVNSIIIIFNGIIMVPLYFHYMPVGVYGAWLASGNLVAMVGKLESGFAGVITQKLSVALANEDDLLYRKYCGANILSALVMSFLIFIVGLSIIPFLSELINVPVGYESDVTMAYFISLISASLSILVSLFGAFPQVWQDTAKVGEINTVVNILGIVAMVVCLITGLGVVSLAIGYVTRAFLNLILQGLWIKSHFNNYTTGKVLYEWTSLKNVLKECFYPFLSKVSSSLMFQSQSFILAAFMNPVVAAYYDITSKVAVALYNFASMTNGSFFAMFALTFAKNNPEESNKTVMNVSHYFALMINTILLYSICFTEPIIFHWVGLDKYGGLLLLVLIVLSAYFNQCKGYLNNLLYTAGYIKKSSILDIICLGIYILVLLVVIKPFQQYSIPFALMLSSFIFVVFYLRLMKEYVEIKIWPLVKTFMFGLMLAGILILCNYFIKYDYTNLFYLIGYCVIFTIIYVGIILSTDRDTSHLIRKYIKV